MRRKKSLKRKLRDEAWRLFSIFTRQNGMDENGLNACYTCGRKVHWKESNAGHYRHDAYDFDERNVKNQCPFCNLGESGRADNYYLHLVEEYGRDVAEELRLRKKWNDYSLDDLKSIVERYGNNEDKS